jgi:hypothetical protein
LTLTRSIDKLFEIGWEGIVTVVKSFPELIILSTSNVMTAIPQIGSQLAQIIGITTNHIMSQIARFIPSPEFVAKVATLKTGATKMFRHANVRSTVRIVLDSVTGKKLK